MPTHVGDNADDGADENGKEMPRLGSDTGRGGDEPDDETSEHGVAKGLELGPFHSAGAAACTAGPGVALAVTVRLKLHAARLESIPGADEAQQRWHDRPEKTARNGRQRQNACPCSR